MHNKSLRELITAIQHKVFSSSELNRHYLDRIQKSTLNAFISVDEDYTMAMAKQADKAIAKGLYSTLIGIPVAHKDNLCTHHFPTTCGSKMLEQFVSPYQATVVEKLSRAGAVTLGKLNMDEFAMGSSNQSSYFGTVKNPWDLERVPGGSSGGSAAAVAAGLTPFSTGTDTGGSVRQPAAYCGLSSIKPTYGLISRFGMVAYASSFDQAAPMARSADDLAILLSIMAGFDERDAMSLNQPVPNYTAHLNDNIKPLRIGLPSYAFDPLVDPAIQQAIRDAVRFFESAGAEIIPIDLTRRTLWAPCYSVLAYAEATSNLARYDGIRYGHRTKTATTARALVTQSRTEGFGKEVKRRLLTGTHFLSLDAYERDYVQAQKVRRLIKDEFQHILNQVDVILGPTTPTCAFKFSDTNQKPHPESLSDLFTVSANLTGHPALSIPCGFNGHLPIGMQLIGHYHAEARLLNIAHYYQQHTHWHLATPTHGEFE